MNLCKDCKYLKRGVFGLMVPDTRSWKCEHPKAVLEIDPMNGEVDLRNSYVMRYEDGECGLEGKLFVQVPRYR